MSLNNINDREFQIVIQSNASKVLHPNNSPANFKVTTKVPIDIRGQWECAIVDIQYPHTWANLSQKSTLHVFIRCQRDLQTTKLYEGKIQKRQNPFTKAKIVLVQVAQESIKQNAPSDNNKEAESHIKNISLSNLVHSTKEKGEEERPQSDQTIQPMETSEEQPQSDQSINAQEGIDETQSDQPTKTKEGSSLLPIPEEILIFGEGFDRKKEINLNSDFKEGSCYYFSITVPISNWNNIDELCEFIQNKIYYKLSAQNPSLTIPKNTIMFKYSSHYRRTTLELDGIAISILCADFYLMKTILGFHSNLDEVYLKKSSPPYYRWNFPSGSTDALDSKLDNDIRTIYVYSDFTEYQIVGDGLYRFMGVFPVQGQRGEQYFWTFNPPYYIPVIKDILQTMELQLSTPTGELVPFLNGDTVVRLHFRKRSNNG